MTRKLTPELAKSAYENLGERPDRLQDDIQALRSWIKKQPHLISRDDDQFILTFLRAFKHRPEESKRRLEAYLTCKTYYPDMFRDRTIDSYILDVARSGFSCVLPVPNPVSGSRLIISQFEFFDVKKFKLHDLFKLNSMIFEILAFEDDVTTVNGLEQVIDLNNCTLQQTLHVFPTDVKKFYTYMDQCIPLRLRRVHVINLRSELFGIYKFVLGILPSTPSFEIMLHEKEEDLHKYIPREFLNDTYGGNNGTKTALVEELEKSIEDHEEYFKKDALLGTNEKLRVEPYSYIQSDFGVDGSFKKLEVD